MSWRKVNYQRTRVRSPVNGYVTNLSAQLGNYADVGSLQLSVVNSDSYWIDAYFEETALSRIREGDAATIKLMGYTPLLRGRVQGLARGINVPNATPDASGLASVNPIFTFVRLAQRVPVRIHIDEVPEGVKLVAGMTATVQIEPNTAPAAVEFETGVGGGQRNGDAGAFLADSCRGCAAGGPRTTAPSQTSPETVAHAAAPSPAQPPVHERVVAQSPPLPVAQDVSPSSAPAASSDQLSVPLPPSPQAAAAADAASADLKTLEQQITANPPSGSASPATAAITEAGRSQTRLGRATISARPTTSRATRARRQRQGPDLLTRSAGAPTQGGGACRGPRGNYRRAAAVTISGVF